MYNNFGGVMVLQTLTSEFARINSINSIVLSGSRVNLVSDEMSDYDIYIYSNDSIPVSYRENIIRRISNRYNVGNTFFEDSDEFFIEKPKEMYFDLMYRRLDWVYHEIENVWRKNRAKLGYTTCFLNNIKNSKILFDRSEEFQRILDELNEPYPTSLAESIVAKNYPMLRKGCAMPYFKQIEIAVKRNDLVSQNHRTAALLASYFDIIFAINKQTHPGEKKLVPYAKKLCKKLPDDFDNDIRNVIQSIGTEGITVSLSKLLDGLDKLLVQEKYI